MKSKMLEKENMKKNLNIFKIIERTVEEKERKNKQWKINRKELK